MNTPAGDQRNSFIVERLEVFNWGPFNGLHRIHVDPRGSAIIGQTGSGKTTLVDALMTLIAERPLYNLASTGGHESDRDLISYIRGVSGEGGEGNGNDHVARQGGTVTALGACFGNGEQKVTLGCLLWLDGSSSSMSDLKRLWIFLKDADQGVADWLSLHRDGGARALKQALKEQGSPGHDAKSGYLAQLRRFFEVGRNAFALLNRAAGLKQLNSVDQLFRELVLEDRAAYKRAEDVVAGFDVLTEIHAELETARRQQQSLLPIEAEERKRRKLAAEVERLEALHALMPVWFAEHAHGLWRQRLDDIHRQVEQGAAETENLRRREAILDQEQDRMHRLYIEAGGGSIEQLEQLIDGQQEILANRAATARQYRAVSEIHGLKPADDVESFERNRQRAAELRDELLPRSERKEAERDQAAGEAFNARETCKELEKELADAQAHEHSNLPRAYRDFKQDLAEELGIDPGELAFVAELLEVKAEQQPWRGAIERALGGNRLRLIIPGEYMRPALRWVNQRHNRLHVRLLDAAEFDRPARFFDDGFTRKLTFAQHPLREALKGFLSQHDLHCVADTGSLHKTPHALTREGSQSGKSGRFDKQDQKALHEGWMTGFDNRDRLLQLQRALDQARDTRQAQERVLKKAKQEYELLRQQDVLLQGLLELSFEAVDTASIERQLNTCRGQLEALRNEDSDTHRAKQAWESVKRALQDHRARLTDQEARMKSLETEGLRAEKRLSLALKRRGAGLSEAQRTLGNEYFGALGVDDAENLDGLELDAGKKLGTRLNKIQSDVNGSEKKLINLMGRAKREDTGALAETGEDIQDVPNYLRQLEVLTKEALPEKLNRFLDYLNKSSDEGVTQLLTLIDNEVSVIEERIGDLNNTLVEVDFEAGRYLQLEPRQVVHVAITEVKRAQKNLRSAALKDDQGESHYRALVQLIGLLRDAVERRKTTGSRALLDPRYRLQFVVKIIAREGQKVLQVRTGSQSGSGGEKEILASYILTASLSYALCPIGMVRPLFGTVVLDEAFSKSSQAVAARIIEALRQFGLHPLFITPNKEMRLLRKHTRSAVLVHRKGLRAATTSLSWEELDEQAAKHLP